MRNSRLFLSHQLGFTLLNILITLVISGILASAGIPPFKRLLNNYQANNAYEQLFTLVQFTRIQSVNYRGQVILCPSTDQKECINDWNQTLMVFVDSNNDETRNADELLLQLKHANVDNENTNWKASGSRRYLRFKADGSTSNQNGRLSYCLESNGEVYARQIIVYRTGRARKASEEEALKQC
ncbi:MAG: GspH/FimT family pseudopilin [Cellvibrionaceae bacterium]